VSGDRQEVALRGWVYAMATKRTYGFGCGCVVKRRCKDLGAAAVKADGRSRCLDAAAGGVGKDAANFSHPYGAERRHVVGEEDLVGGERIGESQEATAVDSVLGTEFNLCVSTSDFAGGRYGDDIGDVSTDVIPGEDQDGPSFVIVGRLVSPDLATTYHGSRPAALSSSPIRLSIRRLDALVIADRLPHSSTMSRGLAWAARNARSACSSVHVGASWTTSSLAVMDGIVEGVGGSGQRMEGECGLQANTNRSAVREARPVVTESIQIACSSNTGRIESPSGHMGWWEERTEAVIDGDRW
jgi:hypothetical protein